MVTITEQQIEQLARERREPNFTFLQLAEMFGDCDSARDAAVLQIKRLIRERNQLARKVLLIDKSLRWVVEEVNKYKIKEVEKKIKYYQNFLNASDPAKKEEMKSRGVNEFDIQKAKEVPIVELLETFGIVFRNEFAPCPWHNEKTGSLHYIKARNSVYCHGCHKHADTISVVQHFRNLNFIEAVKTLI